MNFVSEFKVETLGPSIFSRLTSCEAIILKTYIVHYAINWYCLGIYYQGKEINLRISLFIHFFIPYQPHGDEDSTFNLNSIRNEVSLFNSASPSVFNNITVDFNYF